MKDRKEERSKRGRGRWRRTGRRRGRAEDKWVGYILREKKWRKSEIQKTAKRGGEEHTEKDEKASKTEKEILRWEARKFMKRRGERDRKWRSKERRKIERKRANNLTSFECWYLILDLILLLLITAFLNPLSTHPHHA